jgi:hypothetical protein
MSKINVYHLRTVDTEKMISNKGVIKVGGRPYATVAIEINEDGTVNRGVSICSAKDAFVKKVGTKKAIGRLESAKMRKGNVCAIESFDSTQKRILKKIGGEARFTNTSFEYLGSYRVAPTADELEIFKSDFNS